MSDNIEVTFVEVGKSGDWSVIKIVPICQDQPQKKKKKKRISFHPTTEDEDARVTVSGSFRGM